MADRYWVGGTNTWNSTAGTKWATTSGGLGGASAPTTGDAVFFDSFSTGVVTISTGAAAQSITCTGFTGTLTGTGGTTITVAGGVTLVAGMTYTYTGTLFLSGTGTLITAGKTLSTLTITGASANVTLGDALNMGTSTLTVAQGTFNTNGYSITAGALQSSNTNTRTINLSNSTITLSQTSTLGFGTSGNTGLTFNAGTSTIICTNATVSIQGNIGITFYNVELTSLSAATHSISSPNTFNNLTVTGPFFAGVRQVTFDSRQTINGTLSTTGTAGNRRVWFRGVTYGLAQTLTINSAPSLTDADFRDIYVIGTAAPISGTRVGDLRGCRGITFDTPKTVYWNLAAGGNWSANAWAASSGGAVSTDNFPLAQDTAVIGNTGLNTSATVSMDAAVPYTGTVDMSARTNAMTLSVAATYSIYGNWTNGSGTTVSGGGTLTFSGRNTQTITSAGRTYAAVITIDSYGGSVELTDALNIGNNALTVTNGTFDTKSYNVTAVSLISIGSNVRTITLGSSTLTLNATASPINFVTSTNLTFNADTSQITCTAVSASTSFVISSTGITFYNVSVTSTSGAGGTFGANNTYNNLTITASSSAGLTPILFGGDSTITGTLTVAGATPVRRIFVRSDTIGTQRTLNVGTLSADDCDFRDIAITGTAAGSSPTRAGDCGGNSGITFPAAKTVYWNLAGAQNWSATGWASSSGGTPDINNFPLAQDTAVFDDTGSVTGTITINAAWNIGTFDASARTSAMTLTTLSNFPFVHGDWTFGTGVTSSSTGGQFNFAKRGTQTITSNGVQFGCNLQIQAVTGIVQLADALSMGATRVLSFLSGTFDAVTYNVTIGLFSGLSAVSGSTLKMGSGTWTLSGTGTVWGGFFSGGNFYKGTANIVLSDTSTSARTFAGNSLSYNKLTIGGTTGTSTLTITGNNQFTELASTKTVAHTIALGTTTQTFGKWTVTGTLGNVVTLTGTGTSHILAGACTDGINYLAMGSIGFAATSPGEFYAGANSTGTAAAPVYRTAKPADSTRYWVGGTGNWSSTAKWSASSGGASGASVPRSHDDVIFDSASNATAYTATVNAVTGGIRMKSLTIAGPASGNVTLAGSTSMDGIHGNVTLPATGLTRTYTGAITLSSNSTGLTFTTNGVTLSSAITVNGVDCGWSLGSALTMGGATSITITNGSIDFDTYNLTTEGINSNNTNSRTIIFGSGTITSPGTLGINFGTTETTRANLTVTASTSQISISSNAPTFSGNNQTFYNVSFTGTSPGTITLNGTNSFNNLSFTGSTSTGLKIISVTADQTVTGTLTFSAGTAATMRHFCRSNSTGTTRTITAAAVSMTDVDFRDITIAGAAAPASGTRIGDCKGNSGITFTAAANKYWNLAAGGNWGGAIAWATSSGGTPDINNFPLAQDTCIFEATGLNSGATVTVNHSYNIGTIDMSARTTNTMTLATGSTFPSIYGSWINGTGTTLTGTAGIAFNGRILQTITSSGKNFTQYFSIDSPEGIVRLLDALTTSVSIGNSALTSGTLDLNGYTYTGSAYAFTGTATKTLAIGNQSLVLGGNGSCFNYSGSNLTVTGTGTISLTSGSDKTFAGGSVDYSGITLNQGGVGTLSITGNNTFKTISSTAAGATTINPGNWVQRITTSWTASGSAGNILTITGASATNPGTLVFTGSGQAADVDYLAITGIRAYNLDSTWYAGANSTNNGSLGWIFAAPGGTVFNVNFSDTATGADSIATGLLLSAAFADTATGSDAVTGGLLLSAAFTDTATGSDTLTTIATLGAAFSDTATGADSIAAGLLLSAAFSDTATGSDTLTTIATLGAAFADTATGSDTLTTIATLGAAFADTATGSDTLTTIATLGAAFSDTATGADSIAAGLLLSVDFSDTATGADSIAAGLLLSAAFSDTATGADTLTTTATLGAAFSDTATGADTLTTTATLGVSFSDTATGSDTSSATLTLDAAFSDTATGSDALTTTATLNVAFVDTATGADALAAAATLNVSLSETASGADALSVSAAFNVSLSETATGADALSVSATLNVDFSDTATGLDAFAVAASTFNVSLSETATGLDEVSPAGSTFNVSLSDAGTITDLVAGNYLWNPIDDTQSANWQNVANVQAGSWADVNATQTPDWQSVVTTQTPAWTDVVNPQGPNWVDIQT